MGRPLAYTTLPVPRTFGSEGDRILWRGPLDDRAPDDDALDAFLRLDTASVDRVLAFVRRFGVLRICRHGMPLSHRPSEYGAATPHQCHTRPTDGWDGWESVGEWRAYAAHVRAILNVAARLHLDKTGDDADWETLRKPLANVRPSWRRLPGLKGERETLARAVRALLMLGDVRLGVTWADESPVLELRGDLFGLIAAQVMAAVAKWRGLFLCSRCGYPFSVPRGGRRPRYGLRRYCQTCRDAGAPESDANYDQRHPPTASTSARGSQGRRRRAEKGDTA